MENTTPPNMGSTAVETLPSGSEPADMRRELIRVLSEEINNNIRVVYTHRNRINLVAWLGPFIILGAFIMATGKALPLQVTNWLGVVIPLFFIAVCYLAWMPYVAAGIEQQVWKQCNRLRAIIVQLYNTPNYRLALHDYEDAIQHTVTKGYYAVMLPMMVSAIAVAAIGFNIGGQVPPTTETQGVATSQYSKMVAEPKERMTTDPQPKSVLGDPSQCRQSPDSADQDTRLPR